MVPGEAGPGQGDGSSTSPEVQNPGRLGGMTCLFRPMVAPWWSLRPCYLGLLHFLLLEMQCLILDSFF